LLIRGAICKQQSNTTTHSKQASKKSGETQCNKKKKSYATRKKMNSQSTGQGLHRTTMSLFARQILAAGPAQTITAWEQ